MAVDYKALKAVSFEQAADFLGLTLFRKEGEELRYQCPQCSEGKEGTQHARGLAVHPEKGFTCHISQKKGTDAVALVAHVRGVSQSAAGSMLQERFMGQKPERQEKAEFSTSHPIADMFRLSPTVLEALGGGYSAQIEKLVIPLRLQDGTSVGLIEIATKVDQELLKFPADLDEKCRAPKSESKQQSPDELRRLFRLVS